jgi:hypothetical protein
MQADFVFSPPCRTARCALRGDKDPAPGRMSWERGAKLARPPWGARGAQQSNARGPVSVSPFFSRLCCVPVSCESHRRQGRRRCLLPHVAGAQTRAPCVGISQLYQRGCARHQGVRPMARKPKRPARPRAAAAKQARRAVFRPAATARAAARRGGGARARGAAAPNVTARAG